MASTQDHLHTAASVLTALSGYINYLANNKERTCDHMFAEELEMMVDDLGEFARGGVY